MLNFIRHDFISNYDAAQDWYLTADRGRGSDCLVYLHGHGSTGDQLLTRPDIAKYLPKIEQTSMSVLSPNLRGNAWMNPAAVSDMADLLRDCQKQYGWRYFYFLSGSMGGTGALIFAMLYPELVKSAAILGGATSLRRYLKWCQKSPLPVVAEIRRTILDRYADRSTLDKHDVSTHFNRLIMPIYFYHAADDEIIPVEQARDLAAKCGKNLFYHEIPTGGHDAPLNFFGETLRSLQKNAELA